MWETFRNSAAGSEKTDSDDIVSQPSKEEVLQQN